MSKSLSSNLIECYYDVLSLLNLLEISSYDYGIFQLMVKQSGNRETVFAILKRIKKTLEDLTEYPEINLNVIAEKTEDWIEYLNESYSSKSKWLKQPEGLREDDAKRLLKDMSKFEGELYEIFEESTLMIHGNKKQQIIPNQTKTLDKLSKDDLKEGIKAMDLGLTTAAYMLFFRVAESQVKSYYTKITGTRPIGEKSNWGNMLHELLVEHRPKVNKNLTNLLYYLKDKRNEAQHPGKRFKQNDCEKILHYLSDLIKEISK